jgi:hypothetical protein
MMQHTRFTTAFLTFKIRGIQLHDTRADLVSLTPVREVTDCLPCADLHETQKCSTVLCSNFYAEFRPNRILNVAGTDINSLHVPY